ncbi:hypothetical protein GCM10023193_27110 [Planotetraspora kaengkrachanensis]|uniref:Uncharacterized protein n=1 Tax=Planotetraspora kaengkrachanensis TaxID=575193 RepID=A0A8J3LX03_9ACTN|nr:hypothetical protein Pka01_13870 [Planotetraspora kaengkrachanensis]
MRDVLHAFGALTSGEYLSHQSAGDGEGQQGHSRHYDDEREMGTAKCHRCAFASG